MVLSLASSYFLMKSLPDPAALAAGPKMVTTKIFDRKGVLLYEIYDEQNRTPVKLSDVPLSLKQATIAIEDHNYYGHKGVSLRGMARALIEIFRRGRIQGGSTITQQLVKNALLKPEPTVIRKIKEILLALRTESLYTKDEILEMYLNTVPYGGTAWGIESASQMYFGKKSRDLNLAQAALLAGLPAAPSVYSPHGSHPELAGKRKTQVLSQMRGLGFISEDEFRKAKSERLVVKPPQTAVKAPHFVFYIKELLEKEYGPAFLSRAGLRVATTLDLSLQEETEKIVAREVSASSYLHLKNGAALITNPKTGEILAMVGSKDYWDSENDGNVNVVLSRRQPGSAIKVVTYATALANGWTAATPIDDSPVTFKNDWETYSPVNYDGKFHGLVPLRLALGNSFNVPAVRVLAKLGIDKVVETGRLMGVGNWDDPGRFGLSLTLGSIEISPLELAEVYGVLANSGTRVKLNPLIKITEYRGKTLLSGLKSKTVKAVRPEIAFILTDILSDPSARLWEFGYNTPLNIPGRRVSVKTGTSNEKRDNWAVGYIPDRVVVVWVGNNDNSPMNPYLASGITGAAPVWNKIMTGPLKDLPDLPMISPPALVKINCGPRPEYFLPGTLPAFPCGKPLPSPSPAVAGASVKRPD